MEAPAWLQKSSQLRLTDLSPEHKDELYDYITSLPQGSHLWCKNTSAMRLSFSILSGEDGDGAILYNGATQTLADCDLCVDGYHKSWRWLESHPEFVAKEEIIEKLEAKDMQRLGNYFGSITSILPVEDPIDANIYTPQLTVPLYELVNSPHLLDKRRQLPALALNNFYRCLAHWNFSKANPHIQPTRIAYGMMRMLESASQTGRRWAYAQFWHDFDPVQFSPQFHRLMQHYERCLQLGSTREQFQYALPPSARFFEAMTTNFRRLLQLPSMDFLFYQLDIMTRFGALVQQQLIPAKYVAPIAASLLENGEIAWTGISTPWVLATSLVDHAVIPLLKPEHFVLGQVNDAIGLLCAIIKSASKFPNSEFVMYMTKAGIGLLAAHQWNKESTVIRNSIKGICSAYFERAPPMEAPADIRNLWTSFVDPARDISLIAAAMSAEADFMHHAILDSIHSTATPHRIFPQRMIVNSVVTDSNLPELLTVVLKRCCTLSLLDIKSPTTRILPKHIKYCNDILSNLQLLISRMVQSDSLKFEERQLDTIISISLYYLSSSIFNSSFTNLFLKKVLKSDKFDTTGSGISLEYFITVENAPVAARCLRSVLWDLLIWRYRECTEAMLQIVDWTSRFLLSEWMMTTPCASVGVDAAESDGPTSDGLDDTAVKEDILRLSWMLAKYLLTARKTREDLNTKRFSVPQAAAGAIRILMAILPRHPTSSVSVRAFAPENVEQWLVTLVQVPLYANAGDDALLLSWRALLARIRRTLLEKQFKFSPRFNNSLIKAAGHIQPSEWELLLSTPLVFPNPSTSSSPNAMDITKLSSTGKADKGSIFDNWKQPKPVLNGSALFSGDPSAVSYATSTSSSQVASSSRPMGSTAASSSNQGNRTLPTSVGLNSLLKKKKAVVVEEVPLGPSLQERKEQDAELQRQQAAKRKRDALEAAAASQAPLMILSDASEKHGKTEAQKRKEAHAKARRDRVKSLEELFDKVLGLSFGTLTFPNGDLSTAGRVPNSFVDADEYVSAFEPLLLLELQAQLQTSKEELVPIVQTRPLLYLAEVGQTHELTVLKEREWQGHQVFLMWPKGKAADPKADLATLQRDASLIPHCLGILTKDKKKQNKKQTTLTIEGNSTEERSVVRVILSGAKDHRSGLFSKVQLGAEWNFCPFYSLTTVCREWQALQSVDTLSGLNQILRPVNTDNAGVGAWHPAQVKELVSKLTEERRFNQSQRNAIDGALKKSGFSFIQGPPGTGKTRTLLGLLSIIHALQGAPILVCTPSNSAIDEVIERILSRGLYSMTSSKHDAYNNQFKLVRVGTSNSASEAVRGVTLSELVRQRLSTHSGKTIEQIELSILQSADIVCCTLSSSGSGPMTRANIPFKTVIIDEAAQAVELATLIPLQHQCEKTIMIGDPQQLPATVFSTMATQFLYERSLFARFTASMNAENVLLLNTQYRMHPQISLFPNHHFYKGLLVDGVANSVAPWCSTPIGSELFSPLRFFDLAHSKVNPGAKSLSNDEEVAFIVGMIHKLMASNPSVSFLDKIVVITPYQLQRSRLKIAFEREAQVHGLFRTIDACTVDSYQGKEKEIVIFSTVRAKRGQTIGFLADVRRMNVALTRAKQSLWIIGHSATLQINSEWKALLKSIDDRELRSTVDQSAQDWWSGK
jgi:hypothetical protein